MSSGEARPAIVTCPAPAGEPLSDDFRLRVGGQTVPVYSCRVSAVPLNQTWPGYQRPLDQTELASFATWDMSEPAEVEVVSRRPVESVAIRPSARGIRAAVDGNRITFRMEAPGQVSVEVNGWHHALHLFANPPEDAAPSPDEPGMLYFGPGLHRPGKITLQSNQTVYLAGGSVVYGAIDARGAENIRILGRGILDASGFKRGEGGGCIRLTNCRNVLIDGVILRDPDVWCLSTFACADVSISNVKLIGLWRYNADGIDICNSQRVTVRDCFIRSFDDSIVIKGLKSRSFEDKPVRDVLAERCVIWCDWGRALEIGAETCADEIARVTFRDCDIIRTSHIALDIQHGDRAAVHDVLFETIRLEIDDVNLKPLIQKAREETYPANPPELVPRLLVIEVVKTGYSKDPERGTVRNVTVRDVDVTGKPFPASLIRGYDDEHDVKGVTIEGLRVNGRALTSLQEAEVTVGPHVQDVRFKAP
ncbi:MAG TPA: glycosyl hydrolase family 28 protein [Phycisphaerae bacterium]|nr:glycosyl hydrolase family 28 protein [Phycisphaerae bacterium]